MNNEKVYAYKVKVEEKVREVSKVTMLETDDLNLVKAILKMEEKVTVDSDLPNRNISKEWEDLVKEVIDSNKTKINIEPYQPYPIVTPWNVPKKLVVTC